MKLQAVFYDQDEEMSAVQVLMSADEAAFLVKIIGGLTDVQGDAIQAGGVYHGIYSSLAGVFNSFYDDGVNDYIPRAAR